jgi:hypothetical protein
LLFFGFVGAPGHKIRGEKAGGNEGYTRQAPEQAQIVVPAKLVGAVGLIAAVEDDVEQWGFEYFIGFHNKEFCGLLMLMALSVPVKQCMQRTPAGERCRTEENGQHPKKDVPVTVNGPIYGQVGKGDAGEQPDHDLDIANILFHD